jgi:hypothetical protein
MPIIFLGGADDSQIDLARPEEAVSSTLAAVDAPTVHGDLKNGAPSSAIVQKKSLTPTTLQMSSWQFSRHDSNALRVHPDCSRQDSNLTKWSSRLCFTWTYWTQNP